MAALLEARHVHKIYNSGARELHVLKGVGISVDAAQFVALVGPSGAGKSTLLHILGGLDEPSSGEVLFEGEKLYELDDARLAAKRNRAMGFVFQFYHLLPEFTSLENVAMPALINPQAGLGSEEAFRRGRQLLEQVGLGERMQHFPGQLSGGEKQRVAIARALINGPKLLLCDEPTGNLDSRTGSEIVALIKKLNRDNRMTVVLVTHNADLAKIADRTYQLEDGHVAAGA